MGHSGERSQCPLCDRRLGPAQYVAHMRTKHGAIVSNSREAMGSARRGGSVEMRDRSDADPSGTDSRYAERPRAGALSQKPDPSARSTPATRTRQAGSRQVPQADPLLCPQPRPRSSESPVVVLTLGAKRTERCPLCAVPLKRERVKAHLRRAHPDHKVNERSPDTTDRAPKRIRIEEPSRRKRRGRQQPFACDKCGQAIARGVSNRRFGIVCFKCARLGKQAVSQRMGRSSTSVRTISTPSGGQPGWKR